MRLQAETQRSRPQRSRPATRAAFRRGNIWRPAGAGWWSTLLACALLTTTGDARADRQTLVIEHCAVFDSRSGRMLPDRTVVVSGERIVEVARADPRDRKS